MVCCPALWGIFCNVILFLTKLIVGLVLNSVSVMADAFNNLSDAGSSVISFVGVRMAGKPADKDHPFGHGRIEYIAALIVSFLVLEVGFTFLKDSVGKILHPEQLKFLPVSVLIFRSFERSEAVGWDYSTKSWEKGLILR